MAGQIRQVAGLEYELVRKKVKNLNLRVRRDGTVAVSVPLRASADQADAFVAQRMGWVIAAKQQVARAARKQADCPPPSKEECLALFEPVSRRVYPAFAGVLGGQPPELRVRDMTSRWGVCDVAKKRITLASRLALQPTAAVEYVIVLNTAILCIPTTRRNSGHWWSAFCRTGKPAGRFCARDRAGARHSRSGFRGLFCPQAL